MNMSDQVVTDTPVEAIPVSEETGAIPVSEEPVVETIASEEVVAAEEPVTSSSPPKHGNVLTSLWKKFEKKEPAEQPVTDEHNATAAVVEPAEDHPQDKLEKRLSRTLLGFIHKTVGKSDETAKKDDHDKEPETTAATEVEAILSSEPALVPAEEPHAKEKEPIFEQLRKFKLFGKKPSEGETTTTQPDDQVTTEPEAPASSEPQEDKKGVPLGRRLSRLAQKLTSNARESTKKKTTDEAAAAPVVAAEEEHPAPVDSTNVEVTADVPPVPQAEPYVLSSDTVPVVQASA
ncbi:hypothetical protein DM01DRAFT_1407778 [Hesseltinella vesiculosa]|uniref:Uncharacterized protein n=1 Tax=Hesseltinella vesiculosa TaxID=101127 RepID=A0A1X2GH37_9FUNG|nr:hypothetical protein DM01DRAFT_1407778 [Hesseltinella vesiculosa]